jgi:hypothetical protein
VPGSAFGIERCVRLSYSTSVATIERALGRLASFLAARAKHPTDAHARQS